MSQATTEDLNRRASRAVPTDLLTDPDFQRVLKEKAKESVPSSSESESLVQGGYAEESGVRRKHRKTERRLAKAAQQGVQLLVPSQHPVLIPGPSSPTHFEWRELVTWKTGAVGAVMLFFAYISAKQRSIVHRLGFVYGIAAEFPVLAFILSAMSGIPAQQMAGEIQQFRLGVHPIQRPGILPDIGHNVHQQPPAQEQPTAANIPFSPPPGQTRDIPNEEETREDVIEMLIGEAMHGAKVTRGEIENGKEEQSGEEGDSDEGEDEPCPELRTPQPSPVPRRRPPKIVTRVKEVAYEPPADTVLPPLSPKLVKTGKAKARTLNLVEDADDTNDNALDTGVPSRPVVATTNDPGDSE